MSKHTPTPWKAAQPDPRNDKRWYVVNANGELVFVLPEYGGYHACATKADAAFVVQACNAHEALVEALAELNYLAKPSLQGYAMSPTHSKVERALALAKREEDSARKAQ